MEWVQAAAAAAPAAPHASDRAAELCTQMTEGNMFSEDSACEKDWTQSR